MTMLRITTPVPGYTGVSAGVNFTAGVAEIEVPLDDQQHPHYRAAAYFAAQGYGLEWEDELDDDVTEPEPDDDDLFDPSEHDVPEVLAHLAEADEDEQARVIAAETAGKARSTILKKGAEQ